MVCTIHFAIFLWALESVKTIPVERESTMVFDYVNILFDKLKYSKYKIRFLHIRIYQ